jgi:hypothetical protein
MKLLSAILALLLFLPACQPQDRPSAHSGLFLAQGRLHRGRRQGNRDAAKKTILVQAYSFASVPIANRRGNGLMDYKPE